MKENKSVEAPAICFYEDENGSRVHFQFAISDKAPPVVISLAEIKQLREENERLKDENKVLKDSKNNYHCYEVIGKLKAETEQLKAQLQQLKSETVCNNQQDRLAIGDTLFFNDVPYSVIGISNQYVIIQSFRDLDCIALPMQRALSLKKESREPR